MQNEFTFSEYQEALGESVNAAGLTTLVEQIPPSFFVPTIYFDKVENNEVKEVCVPLTKMSSGERQYLYNFSTVIYHMRNLLSIQDTQRIRYRSIHLVFDEVEICFHPEYQRKFINSLLTILNRTRITRHCAVQITIATHSPFILSDVTQDNILYLEEGCDVFIRFNEAIGILHKVKSLGEPSFEPCVSTRKPFGFDTLFHGKRTAIHNGVTIYDNDGDRLLIYA